MKLPIAAVLLGALYCGATFAPAAAQTSDLVDRAHLRVCADPANMPFSNDKGEGFENKIAELLAKDLGVRVEYTWFPQATGFVRNTLNAGKCDVVIGFAQGDELVQNTNHYYRSGYVFVTKQGGPLADIDTLEDPRLKDKVIGIVAGTPPGNQMAANGLMGKARPYPLTVDRRYEAPAERMVADTASGEIDAGILWGPIAGFYAKKSSQPLTVTPLVKEAKGPRLAYRITMGLRSNEPNWKKQLNDLIKKNQPEINTILASYGVPLLDEQDRLIKP